MDAGVNEIDLSRRSAFDELGVIALGSNVAVLGKVVQDGLKFLGRFEGAAQTHYVTAAELCKTVLDDGGQYILALLHTLVHPHTGECRLGMLRKISADCNGVLHNLLGNDKFLVYLKEVIAAPYRGST